MKRRSGLHLSPQSAGQNKIALEKNRSWFTDNDWYKSVQQELEVYRLIALCAARETSASRRLLDIGNGGVFTYPISHIPEVVAIDIFIEESFSARYPGVQWVQMSALEMQFDQSFDTIIEINALHHIIGDSVHATYQNLDRFLAGVARNLETGGKAVLIESTVPRWFLAPYKLMFTVLLKLWPLAHPPTFQFHFREILQSAARHGLKLAEFCWVPKISDVMTFGARIKPWMTPVQIGKFVFFKR